MEDESDMRRKRCNVSETRSTSLFIDLSQLMNFPDDMLRSISSFIPHNWYLRQLNKRFASALPLPTKMEINAFATEMKEKYIKNELSTFDIYLSNSFNIPKNLFQNVQFLPESTLVDVWRKFPSFGKALWYNLIAENNRNGDLPPPIDGPYLDPQKNAYFYFQLVASLKILNIHNQANLAAINRVIFDVTEMSEFAEEAQFDKKEEMWKISLRVQRNSLEVKHKDKAKAVATFRFKLFQFIIQHLESIDAISQELQKSSQYKNYIIILEKRVGWNYHHGHWRLFKDMNWSVTPNHPEYTLIEANHKWIARVTVINQSVQSEKCNNKAAAKRRAAKLFVRRFGNNYHASDELEGFTAP